MEPQSSDDSLPASRQPQHPIAAVMDAIKTLPASWFTSPNLYKFEIRAVFHKAWYLVGPVTRFATASTVAHEIAGVRITVSHTGNEHFTITRDSDGLELKHFLTPTGLLFTTIHPLAPLFHEWFPDSLLPLLNKHDFRHLPHRRSIKYPGRFNWKTMVDGYQECLHCQYTHRSFSVKYPPTFYEVHNHGTYSQHIADPTKPEDGLFLYFFPVCTLNLYGGGMSSFRVCPGNPVPLEDHQYASAKGRECGVGNVGETRMEFDYYFCSSDDPPRDDLDDGFDEYFRFVRRVAMEDFELCETAQENLERGVYSQGVLNKEKESGVLHYQQLTRKMVTDKFREEQEEEEHRNHVGNSGCSSSSRVDNGFGQGLTSIAAPATGEEVAVGA